MLKKISITKIFRLIKINPKLFSSAIINNKNLKEIENEEDYVDFDDEIELKEIENEEDYVDFDENYLKEKDFNKRIETDEINSTRDILEKKIPNLEKIFINEKQIINLAIQKTLEFEKKIKESENFENLIYKRKFLFSQIKFGLTNTLRYIKYLLDKKNLVLSEKNFLKDYKVYMEYNFKLFSLETKKEILLAFSNLEYLKYNLIIKKELIFFFKEYIYNEIDEEKVYEIFQILPFLNNLKTKTSEFRIDAEIRKLILIYFGEKEFDLEKLQKLYNLFKSKKNSEELILNLYYSMRDICQRGKYLRIIFQMFSEDQKNFRNLKLKNLQMRSVLILTNFDINYSTKYYTYFIDTFKKINPKKKTEIDFYILNLISLILKNMIIEIKKEDNFFFEYWENYLKKEISEIKKLLQIKPENFLFLKIDQIHQLKNFLEVCTLWERVFRTDLINLDALGKTLNEFLKNKYFEKFLNLENPHNYSLLKKFHQKENLENFENNEINLKKNKNDIFIHEKKINIFEIDQLDISSVLINPKYIYYKNNIQDVVFQNFNSQLEEDFKLGAIIDFLKIQKINLEYFEIINEFLFHLNFDDNRFDVLKYILRMIRPEIIEKRNFIKLFNYFHIDFPFLSIDYNKLWIEKKALYDKYEFNIS